ncbi:EAL domain-containing protein [Rossellomorea aquimaris]|uniref:EAL domain-containing protein n=1 Tax=Rossellomorea aquimaris TaxID=189382 RepID=UPI001CD59C6C|nr:EAL domain-containing protein [Rossellomorea aquimaris]MCA1057043.1 EAL domain-containing protein [Rossellomorea aquimaris]
MNIFTIFQNDFIYHEYQPLFTIDGSQHLYGYEALMRNIHQVNPEALFHTAMKANILYKLDTLSISKAIEGFCRHQERGMLFVNVYVTTLLHPSFLKYFDYLMETNPGLEGRLVFELNESTTEELWQNPLLSNVLTSLKQYGVLFAIDDFGQGTASIKKSIEFEPDIIKLDRYFAKDLAINERKQRFISFFNQFYGNETLIILEGIEREADMMVAKELGISVGQGYFLGRPSQLLA